MTDIADLQQIIATKAIDSGLEKTEAEALAAVVVKAWVHEWAGCTIYIPSTPPKLDRNRRVLSAFNGRNHQEICKQFCISLSTLYRILKNVQSKNIDRNRSTS